MIVLCRSKNDRAAETAGVGAAAAAGVGAAAGAAGFTVFLSPSPGTARSFRVWPWAQPALVIDRIRDLRSG
ncbi:MAG: hypothetical protein WB440_05325 [Steroidobacteraceae bacterium]